MENMKLEKICVGGLCVDTNETQIIEFLSPHKVESCNRINDSTFVCEVYNSSDVMFDKSNMTLNGRKIRLYSPMTQSGVVDMKAPKRSNSSVPSNSRRRRRPNMNSDSYDLNGYEEIGLGTKKPYSSF